jgi:hypothetical protein
MSSHNDIGPPSANLERVDGTVPIYPSAVSRSSMYGSPDIARCIWPATILLSDITTQLMNSENSSGRILASRQYNAIYEDPSQKNFDNLSLPDAPSIVGGLIRLIGALEKLRGNAPDESRKMVHGGNTVVELSVTRNVLYRSGRCKLLTEGASIERRKEGDLARGSTQLRKNGIRGVK